MTLLLVIVAIVGFLIAFFVLGPGEHEPKRCPTCGLEALFSLYHAGGGPRHWMCERCGAEFRQQGDEPPRPA